MQLDDSGIKHFNTMQDLPTPLPARFANRPDMEVVRDGVFKITIQGLRLIYLYRRTTSSVIMHLEMLFVTAGKK